jgi:hypothetical protein
MTAAITPPAVFRAVPMSLNDSAGLSIRVRACSTRVSLQWQTAGGAETALVGLDPRDVYRLIDALTPGDCETQMWIDSVGLPGPVDRAGFVAALRTCVDALTARTVA